MKRILLAVLLLGSVTASANITIFYDSVRIDNQVTVSPGRIDINEDFFIVKGYTTEMFAIKKYEKQHNSQTMWGVSPQGKWLGIEVRRDKSVFLWGDKCMELLGVEVKVW